MTAGFLGIGRLGFCRTPGCGACRWEFSHGDSWHDWRADLRASAGRAGTAPAGELRVELGARAAAPSSPRPVLRGEDQ